MCTNVFQTVILRPLKIQIISIIFVNNNMTNLVTYIALIHGQEEKLWFKLLFRVMTGAVLHLEFCSNGNTTMSTPSCF